MCLVAIEIGDLLDQVMKTKDVATTSDSLNVWYLFVVKKSLNLEVEINKEILNAI